MTIDELGNLPVGAKVKVVGVDVIFNKMTADLWYREGKVYHYFTWHLEPFLHVLELAQTEWWEVAKEQGWVIDPARTNATQLTQSGRVFQIQAEGSIFYVCYCKRLNNEFESDCAGPFSFEDALSAADKWADKDGGWA